MKELRRDSVRTSSKGLRDEGVKPRQEPRAGRGRYGALMRGLRRKGRRRGMDGLPSVAPNLADSGGAMEGFRIKGALLRSVSVNLAELSPSPRLRRTRRKVFEMNELCFMVEIVAYWVGHWWG